MRADRLNHITSLVTAVLIVWCSGSVELLTLQQEKNLDTELMYDVVKAIERATSFFEEDYASINVDGLFGIRLCQGSIIESLNDCSLSKFNCPQGLTDILANIKARLNKMADMALPYVELQDSKYFQGFLQVIDAPYIVQYLSESLGDSIADPGYDNQYDEDKGDACYAKLMGTFSDNERTYPKCTITDSCWNYMTREDTSSYYVTHQLLFFIFGEKNKCVKEIEEHVHRNNGTSVRDVEKHLCGKIYSEAKGEEASGNVDTLKQDLFLEQSGLCGLLGFEEFFNRTWMRMVLGWQKPNGCFTMPRKLVGIQERLNVISDRHRQLMDLLYEEARNIDEARPMWMGRKLMREQTMNGDCLAHKTGLAFGTLGTYIRHLIHQLYRHS